MKKLLLLPLLVIALLTITENVHAQRGNMSDWNVPPPIPPPMTVSPGGTLTAPGFLGVAPVVTVTPSSPSFPSGPIGTTITVPFTELMSGLTMPGTPTVPVNVRPPTPSVDGADSSTEPSPGVLPMPPNIPAFVIPNIISF